MEGEAGEQGVRDSRGKGERQGRKRRRETEGTDKDRQTGTSLTEEGHRWSEPRDLGGPGTGVVDVEGDPVGPPGLPWSVVGSVRPCTRARVPGPGSPPAPRRPLCTRPSRPSVLTPQWRDRMFPSSLSTPPFPVYRYPFTSLSILSDVSGPFGPSRPTRDCQDPKGEGRGWSTSSSHPSCAGCSGRSTGLCGPRGRCAPCRGGDTSTTSSTTCRTYGSTSGTPGSSRSVGRS